MGAPLLVVENAASDPVGRLGDWLTETGLEVQVLRPHRGDSLPERVAGGGVVLLGGPMGAHDDERAPWLPAERELIRTLIRDEIPTLGICLGHQLLAAATGGTVRKRPDGPELGALLVAKRTASATDPLFQELPITPDVVQWHFDEVVALPPGAVQLANSPVCENQAFRLGRLAWGLQFHIETTPDMVRGWAASYGPELSELGYDVDVVLERVLGVHDDLEEVWRPFAHRFAAVVADPDAVRPRRGPVVSTAEPITDPAAIRAALAAEMGAARGTLPMPEVRRDD